MKKSAELKQLRATKIAAQKALHTKAEAEKRSLNETETTEFRTLQTEIEGLSGQITDAENYEANLRSVEGADPVPGANQEGEERGGKNPKKEKRTYSINKAIRSLMQNGKLDGIELEYHQRASAIAKEAGVAIGGLAIPLFDSRSVETRAAGQTSTEDSGGFGGNAVATEVQAPIDFLRPEPVVEKLGAVFLTGLQGNLKFPKNNGGVTATWEGEVDTVDPTKNAFGSIEMTPKRLAVTVLISLQNLMQSSFDMEQYTMGEIRKVIGNAIDLAAINGSGTGQPLGVLNTSGVNTVAIGTNGGAPTFAALVAMETEVYVDNAQAPTLKYLSNPKVRGKLKVTPKESGQPVYLMNPDGTVNGYPFETTNHVPSNLTKGTASGVCSAIVFGDWSQVVVGQWGFMDLSVDDKSRKKDGYIEVTANVFVDIAVKQPTAFTVCKDLTTT
jgi:HK97 family phage major capsid protein